MPIIGLYRRPARVGVTPAPTERSPHPHGAICQRVAALAEEAPLWPALAAEHRHTLAARWRAGDERIVQLGDTRFRCGRLRLHWAVVERSPADRPLWLGRSRVAAERDAR